MRHFRTIQDLLQSVYELMKFIKDLINNIENLFQWLNKCTQQTRILPNQYICALWKSKLGIF
jgi:hypothetical protein